MARNVTDASILLGAMEGAAPDPNDPATSRCQPPPNRDYTRFLKRGALKGRRIGVPRAFFFDQVTPPGAKEPRGGLNPAQAKAMEEAIAVLKARRAPCWLIRPSVPSVVDPDPAKNIVGWKLLRQSGRCAGQGQPGARSSSGPE